ncbi:cyclin protein [Stemphylium lycopersici]|uniref:Cyclin protein n=1 Tax=Stemphylium lycopersici TaxID=183478 RepID=A0A364MVJ0_STELY|nr:cyclin protein [Stemphylium lycopersici]RAR04446.1 cyclin protein [Stemphylium lycopersici]RAR05680.1 cyclin protein [Stemphylium lycopersici]
MPYSPNLVAESNAALDHFIQLPVSHDMISYLAQKATQVIRCEPSINKNLPPTPPASPPQHAASHSREPSLPSVEEFITSIVERSHVQTATLMSSLVYLSRLRSRLPPVAKGMRCTVHRIFLASLILAAKNLNDSSPKNKHWARYSAVRGYENFGFSITEVNLMEKQLLFLLDWDLRINTEDLHYHLEPFLAPIRVWQSRQAEKARLAEKEKELARQQYQLTTENLSRSVHPYASNSSMSSYASRPQRSRYHPSSRAPSRTPSLSPPTRSSSVSIKSESPASFHDEPSEAVLHRYDADQGANVVYINGPIPYAAPKQQHALPLYEHQPSKKVKTSAGGIFSRMFGQTGTYAGRQTSY